MAVFTPVGRDELDVWLTQYDVGDVSDFCGISAGIENSNFFVTTSRGAWVLTVFERLTAEQLPFYLELMRHLAARGVACPAPLPTRDGRLFSLLHGKPAALVSRLSGAWVADPSLAQCAQAGEAMAKLHLAGRDFGVRQPNLRGLDWWRSTVPEVLPFLDAERAELLSSELEFQLAQTWHADRQLPSGAIHADLFRDNALFDGDRLGGIIDFYFAGWDHWLFDVAVSVNDWCIVPTHGTLIAGRASAFLNAYAAVRPFNDAERAAWPAMLRAAALRFWLSRLWDFYLPRPAEMLTPHDPTHFERILRARRDPESTYANPLPASS